MALLDDINRLLRDHTGYTGDGQGGNGAVPVGDRSTARWVPDMRDLRELMIAIAQTMGDPSALQSIITQLGAKADIANSGKTFVSRAAAVAFGQQNLPSSLGQIETREGNFLVVRSPTAGADDPLFDTGARWGVVARLPNTVAFGAGAVIPLTVITAATTANDISADISPELAPVTVKTGSSLRVVPTLDNTGSVLLRVGAAVLNLRDETGASLAPKALRAGVPFNAVVTASNEARIVGLNQDRAIGAAGELPTGSDINTITVPGTYYGNPASTYTNLPEGFSGKQFFLEVGAGKAAPANVHRWVKQVIWDAVGMSSPQARRIDALNPATSYSWSLIGGGYVGQRLGVGLESILTAGIYLVGGGFSGGPSGFAQTSGWLQVEIAGSYIHQTLKYLAEPSMSWRRAIQRGSPNTLHPWSRSGGGSGGASPYADRSMVVFGDSIPGNSDYPERMGSRLGLTAVNVAIGGTRLGPYPGNVMGAFSMTTLADAVVSGAWTAIEAAAQERFEATGVDYRPKVALMKATNWLDVDYVLIAFGSNDWAGAVPTGLPTDATTATICGSANYVIDKLWGAFPHLKIMLVTPHWRARQQGGDGKDSDSFPNPTSGEYLLQVVDGLRAVGDRWHLPVCDSYRTFGLNLLTYRTYLRDQTVDGIHPYGAVGAQLFADKIAAAFTSHF